MRFGLKRNNKGNTLGVVLVGIFILSILGTLILGVTATNYKMKVNEKNSETSFYYAEKAVDDIYAGIGNDVMTAIKESYTDVLETYVVSGATYDKTIANDKFINDVRTKIKDLYKSGTTYVPALLTALDADIDEVSGYTYKVYNPSGTQSTEVKYYKKEIDPSSGLETEVDFIVGTDPVSKICKVVIKNVGVSCESRLGYSSKLITDFEIRIPDVEIDLTDSAVSGSLEDLCQYSIISEGFNLQPAKFSAHGGVGRNKSAIKINDNANVNITGNIYAGGIVYDAILKTLVRPGRPDYTYYVNNISSIVEKLPAIEVGDNAKLNINAKIINCESDFVLGNNSDVKLRNLIGNDNSVNQLDSLQFYTRNIITNKNTTGANVDIVGNCIVKDDLEINGNNSSVTLKGNYFGYGFRDRNDDGEEDNSTELTSNLGFESKTLIAEENEESSAIIINGSGANLDMSQIGKLVLGGRAYIDLDAIGTKNTYMTGESISLKGNQQMYMADDTELQGSLVVGNNPIKFPVLQSMASTTLNSDVNMISSYASLGINSNNVIAKKIDDDVFFYKKNEAPSSQTDYFIAQYNDNSYKRTRMIEQAAKLGVVNLSINPVAEIYSVGTVITVDTSSGQTEITAPISGENGITKEKFKKILSSIENRKNNLTPSLNDVSKLYVLGNDDDIVDVVLSDVSPYEYYINREYLIKEFAGDRLTVEIDLQNLDSENSYLSNNFGGMIGLTVEQQRLLKEQILSILGDSYKTKKVGYAISCEGGTGGSSIELDAGVVVSECPYTINKDFKGLILSGDEMYISGNISIEAAAELAELLLTTCPQLKAILSPEFQSNAVDETGTVVNVASLKYTDLVDKTNWRKDN